MRSLAQGLAEALPQLAEVLPQIAENIGNFFNEHSADLLRAGAEILGYIVTGILDSFPLLFDALAELVLTSWEPETKSRTVLVKKLNSLSSISARACSCVRGSKSRRSWLSGRNGDY